MTLGSDSAVHLHDALNAYQQVMWQAEHDNGRGSIELLGWHIEYVDAYALASFIDQLLIRRLNDFVADRDDPVIIDCGANIGIGLLNYKRQYPRARIIAFEPDKDFLPCLHENLRHNGIADINVIEAAAWMEKGEMPWLAEGRDGSRILSTTSVEPTRHVATYDLADYLKEHVDLLKLDIEGAEYAVIPHVMPWLQNVDNIIVECHLAQDNYRSFAAIIDDLKTAGFDIAINTYGPWRDLLRQPEVSADHWQQYGLICGWRHPPRNSMRELACLPYLGPDPLLEQQHVLAELAEYLHAGFLSKKDSIQTLEFSGPYHADGGWAFIKRLPAKVPPGDNERRPRQSRLLLFEEDRLLGPAHMGHEEVRDMGRGCYSHWGDILHFSSSDGSDPNSNGRRYTLVYILCDVS